MHTPPLIQRIALAAASIAVIAAAGCTGGDINIHGPEWPWPWPLPNEPPFVAEDTYDKTIQVEGHVRLLLDAKNGHVSINGQPDADTVTVTAQLLVGSYSSLQDAQNGLDNLAVRVDAESDEILVETLQPGSAGGRQYVVNYTIAVPADMAVDVKQTNGDIRVEDTADSVIASTQNGGILGDLTVPLDGEIQLSTVNGGVELHIPASTSASLSATVGNGSITYRGLDLQDAVSTDSSLTGTLGDGDGVIRLETTNGNVNVVGIG